MRRFLRQRQETLDNIARLEDLIKKALDAEEAENDPDVLRRYIATRINLEANLSDSKAFLLRTNKAIEREKAWLVRYDAEGDTLGGEDVQESDEDTEDVPQATSIGEAERVLGPAAPPRKAPAAPHVSTKQELLERALVTVGSGEIGSLSLEQMELLTRYFVAVGRQASQENTDDGIKAILAKALITIDTRLAELHQLAALLKRGAP